MIRQLPIPMVALVATAVSVTNAIRIYTNLKYKLYAALHEWRTGEHKRTEFSASMFLDVYQGHVNMLRYILERRSTAFHAMMGYIFSQAR